MNDTTASEVQGLKYFSYHMTLVNNLDNTELPGFCKQIFSEKETSSFPPPHTFTLY